VFVEVVYCLSRDLGNGLDGLACDHLLDLNVAGGVGYLGDFDQEIALLAPWDLGF